MSISTAGYLNGYNTIPDFIDNSTIISNNTIEDPSITTLGYESSMVSNFNVMFAVQVGALALLGLVYVIHRAVKNKATQAAKDVSQRLTLALVLFNSSNFLFSSALIN